MRWSPEVKERLLELKSDTPITYKQYLEHCEASAEMQAVKLGKSEVDDEAMVRGYITAVPRHLRDGITEVLSEHNYDLMYFRPVFDEPNFANHNHDQDHRAHA